MSEPTTAADRREPVDVLGDELCRTSFPNFTEDTFRRIAARLVGRLHALGFRIERIEASDDPDFAADVARGRRASAPPHEHEWQGEDRLFCVACQRFMDEVPPRHPLALDVERLTKVIEGHSDALLHGTLESPREVAGVYAAEYARLAEPDA